MLPMNLVRTLVTLFFCLCISALYAQEDVTQKQRIISFGVTLSNYNSVKHATDSAAHNSASQKGLFKPGNGSFGMEVSYWKHLMPHINFSGNLGFDLSNFPAGFVKGDSIGQASVSVHLDGLIHLNLFAGNAKVNPFVTAGAGGGYFGKQVALYAPLGAGVAFHFDAGGIIILQLQMRKALSPGITNDFMFYSAGFAQNIPSGTAKKHESHKDEVIKSSLARGHGKNSYDLAGKIEKRSSKKPKEKASSQRAMETITSKNEINESQVAKVTDENKVDPSPDADNDGVADKDDKCPGIKGSVENKGCPFPEVEGAELLNMSADSATYSIHFDFDQSVLQTGAFSVLNRIVQILKLDKTLTIDISGHADNQGTDFKNMQVSADRAKVARDYFMSYSIDASRIKSSYYGATRPIDNVQQWRNRRVEITIIKK